MKVSYMAQRLEFLDCGEKLGWPRIGRLRAGRGNWEGMARADHRRFIPLLRAAKIRVENMQGQPESDLARTVLYGDVLRGLAEAAFEAPAPLTVVTTPSQPDETSAPDLMVQPPRYTAAMRRANLAKAREAKKAKTQVTA